MKYLIIILSICSVMNCSKTPEMRDEYITLTYAETQCSDVWTRGSTDVITKQNFINYCNTQNIYVADVTIKPPAPGMGFCAACTCPTGNTIYVTTLKSDALINKLKALGFK